MKKNVYLIIIWAITMVCIITGCAIHSFKTVGSIIGGVLSNGSSEESKVTELKGDAFDKIEIDMGAGNLEVTSGSEFYVKTDGRLTAEIRDGKLIIKSPDNISVWPFSSDSGAGNAEIRLPWGIDKIDADMGAGNAVFSEVEIKNIDIDMGAGDAEFKDVTFEKLDLDKGAGNTTVVVADDTLDYDIDIDNGIGEIVCLGNKASFEYERKGNGPKIVIDQGIGNVTVE